MSKRPNDQTVLASTPSRSAWLVQPVVVLACLIGAMLSFRVLGPTTLAGGSPVHAGLAVVVMLAYGWRGVLGVFVGAWLSNASLWFGAYGSPWTLLSNACVLAAATTLQGWLGAAMVRRTIGYPNPIDSARSVAWFLACAGPLPCSLSAVLVAAWLKASHLLPAAEIGHQALHWAATDTIGVFLLSPLVLVLIGEPKATWRSRRYSLIASQTLGCLVVLVAFARTRTLEQASAHAEFREDAAALTHALEAELAYVISAPEALAQLWIVSGHVSREQFRAVAARARALHPAILALEWLPRVRASETVTHEALGRAELGESYRIKQLTTAGGWEAVTARDEYFPTFYIEPDFELDHVFGFDLGSESVRALTIQRAQQSASVSVSPRVQLMLHKSRPPAVLAVVPAFAQWGQTEASGFVVCAIRLDYLVQRAVEKAGHNGLALRLEDVRTESQGALLATFGGDHARPDTALELIRTLRAGDRTWRLVCWRTRELVAASEALQSSLRLLRGLLFSVLLSVPMLLVTGRMGRTEALVTERTAELLSINKDLIAEIDTRWKAQRALAESELRWQFALEGADAGVWDWHLSSDEAFYSAHWKQLFGYAPEAPGPSLEEWRSLVHDDDLPMCIAQFELVLKTPGALYHVEHRMRRRDGTEIWTLTRGKVVVRAPSGQALRVIGTQTDITARKTAEHELERHRDHLDELVRTRTHDLDTARLFAERCDRVKTTFLRNMSHEIRTPLHAVFSYAQLGAESSTGEDREYFESVLNAVAQLHKLLGNLLELSILETKQQPLQKSTCDLRSLITVLIRQLQGDDGLSRHRIELVSLPLAISTTLEADPLQLTSTFRQLLVNAMRYSASGSTIRVELERLRTANGPDVLEARVIDQGVGVPTNELEEIFDSFVQGSHTRTNAGGTGIGLAICRAVITQHGGTIHAANNASGIGACFVVRLPVAVEGVLAAS